MREQMVRRELINLEEQASEITYSMVCGGRYIGIQNFFTLWLVEEDQGIEFSEKKKIKE